MRVFEAIFDEEKTDGVFGISLVENPAMEDFWITLSEQPKEVQFSAVNDEKKLLLGAVLIPNKKVLRIDSEGNEFFITFTKDTIGQLAHNFLKKGFQNNSSLEHEIKLSDVSFVESWQVEDTEKDKSALYGKQYEPGTWVTMAKVSDDNYEKAKNGELKGFSIDGLLGLKPIQLNKLNMNNEEKKSFLAELKEDIKSIFLSQKEEVEAKEVEQIEVKEEVEATEVETPTFDAEAFARDLKEQLSVEFKKEADAFKKELETKLEEKEKEIEDLKVQLSKQPEVEPVKAKVEKTAQPKVQINNPINTKSRAYANIASTMNWN